MGAGADKCVFHGVEKTTKRHVAIKLSAPGSGDAEAQRECDTLDAITSHENVVRRLFKAIGADEAVPVPRALFSDATQLEKSAASNNSGAYAPLQGASGLFSLDGGEEPLEFIDSNIVVEELGGLGELLDILQAVYMVTGAASVTTRAALTAAVPALFRQVVSGLAHMHGDGTGRAVAHGDVKSQNVCITNNMRVLLIDFGSAFVIDDAAGRASYQRGVDPRTSTFPFATAGSPATKDFTSREKEMAKSNSALSFNPFANDVYSAAVVLFQMHYANTPTFEQVAFLRDPLQGGHPDHTAAAGVLSLLHGMMRDEATRFTMAEVLAHPYLAEAYAVAPNSVAYAKMMQPIIAARKEKEVEDEKVLRELGDKRRADGASPLDVRWRSRGRTESPPVYRSLELEKEEAEEEEEEEEAPVVNATQRAMLLRCSGAPPPPKSAPLSLGAPSPPPAPASASAPPTLSSVSSLSSAPTSLRKKKSGKKKKLKAKKKKKILSRKSKAAAAAATTEDRSTEARLSRVRRTPPPPSRRCRDDDDSLLSSSDDDDDAAPVLEEEAAAAVPARRSSRVAERSIRLASAEDAPLITVGEELRAARRAGRHAVFVRGATADAILAQLRESLETVTDGGLDPVGGNLSARAYIVGGIDLRSDDVRERDEEAEADAAALRRRESEGEGESEGGAGSRSDALSTSLPALPTMRRSYEECVATLRICARTRPSPGEATHVVLFELTSGSPLEFARFVRYVATALASALDASLYARGTC